MATLLRLANAETFANEISLYKRQDADENDNDNSNYDFPHASTPKNPLYSVESTIKQSHTYFFTNVSKYKQQEPAALY